MTLEGDEMTKDVGDVGLDETRACLHAPGTLYAHSRAKKAASRLGTRRQPHSAAAPSPRFPFARSGLVCQSSGNAKRAARRAQTQERLASADGHDGQSPFWPGARPKRNCTSLASASSGPARWERGPSLDGLRARGPSSASRVA
ncbi:hypothetical protein G7Z17_g2683 [Cylindrodendrum hubeiense]|uniref:Uncharacterized protein n=1 Tax=Cylindrodendrum hubeiense TaxID=595255 RepID=A0A9P5LK45_9HYPO|nr:hypothetical protein G7Z17_g2683 [Cylindrodendrum hubeiense]